MDAKELEVDCPCCASRLWIDVRTRTVVRALKPGESDETGKTVLRESDWSAANERVSKRMGGATDKFDESLSREKKRSQDLDELFRKASDKLKGKEKDKGDG